MLKPIETMAVEASLNYSSARVVETANNRCYTILVSGKKQAYLPEARLPRHITPGFFFGGSNQICLKIRHILDVENIPF